jgi:hypothetical protein
MFLKVRRQQLNRWNQRIDLIDTKPCTIVQMAKPSQLAIPETHQAIGRVFPRLAGN